MWIIEVMRHQGDSKGRVSLCIVSNLACRIFDPRVFPKFHPFLPLRHKSRFSFGKFVHEKRKSLSYQRDWLYFLAEFLVLPCVNIFGWWKVSVRAWCISLDRMTRPRMCASKALPDFDWLKNKECSSILNADSAEVINLGSQKTGNVFLGVRRVQMVPIGRAYKWYP